MRSPSKKAFEKLMSLGVYFLDFYGKYQEGGGGGGTPVITYTGMCRPTGYPFQRRFLEWGIKNCESRLYLLLKIVADYKEAFI